MSVFVHDRILELLEAEGLKTLFGIPDPSFVAMFIAAEARGWRVIAPHHEQAGAFMADGLWRMTGKPGVIIGNQGPGVANLAPAAICAAKENTPTIFIAGQRQRLFEQRVRRGRFQYTHQPRYFEEAMKYVGTIEYPEQTDEIVHEAFRRALSGTPGPVYIEYPMNVMQAQLDLPPAPAPQAYRLTHQEASQSALADALALIGEAKLPILLVGQGVFVSRAHEAVAALARALACPVIQTPGGAAFLEGLEERTFAYASPAGTEAIAKSDLVIAVGTEIGEPIHYGHGRHWANGNTARKWIYIERDPTAIGVNRHIDAPLVGDLRDVVPQLTAAVTPLARTRAGRTGGLGEGAGRTQGADAGRRAGPFGSGPSRPLRGRGDAGAAEGCGDDPRWRGHQHLHLGLFAARPARRPMVPEFRPSRHRPAACHRRPAGGR